MDDFLVGRVLRSSTGAYTCGTRSNELSTPSFGAFVQTSHDPDSGIAVMGLIYGIRIDDDPLVRQLIMANHMTTSAIRDQRENRMIPVEINVVNIGYRIGGECYHSMPLRPPVSLDAVYLCDNDAIYDFTQSFDFFRLVLNTSDVPTEELLASALKHAAAARPPHEQTDFLIRAGRRLAQLLSHDLPRLHHLLRLIKP